VSLEPTDRGGTSGSGDALGTPLLTAEQVAAFLRCSPEMVYKLRRLGRLKAVRVGAMYRFRPETVQAYVASEEDR
jgi:excisionase family DNA binding protein